MDKEVIAVGDSTRLEIIFTAGHAGARTAKQPRIQTNEGPPDKYVRIVADVVARPDSTYPVVMSPYKVDMSQFTEKVVAKATFEIKNVSDQKLVPTLISKPSGLFEVKLPKVVEPGASVTAEIKLDKSALDKSFEKSITFVLDDEKKTRFTVPVKRTVRDMTKSTGASTGTSSGH